MEMLFYRDLKQVSILPRAYAYAGSPNGIGVCHGFCEAIDHDVNDEDAFQHGIETVAILSAGKIAVSLFDACAKEEQTTGYEDGDEGQLAKYKEVDNKLVESVLSATNAAIHRHRPQLDAIVEALIEHETLSGDKVMDVMLASNWNPEADVDPVQFANEVFENQK
jgi:hypothetical protein